jgi:hypothetical protein
MGAVIELPNGLLQARHRYYIPADLEDLVIEGLRFGLTTIAGTIAFNAVAKRDGDPARRFQRVVDTTSLPSSMVPEVRSFLEERLLRLTEELDDAISIFSRSKNIDPETETPRRRIGVGLYYFDED